MKLRILHLEDNADDAHLVRLSLALGGLDFDVLPVHMGDAFLAALARDNGAAGVPEPTAAMAKGELETLAPASRTALCGTAPLAEAALETGFERTSELQRRSAQLEVLHREFESFTCSLAHDLRGPLITIDGFSQVLLDTSDHLDGVSRGHLERIGSSVRHMHRLINDLLELSKVVRAPMHPSTVDLSREARQIAQKLRESAPARSVTCEIADNLVAHGDASLLSIALEQLFSNAWKFTSKSSNARIEFGVRLDRSGRRAYFVRDNGAGFDPRDATNLFSPFRRLHPESQFPGSGIGLASVQRIIHRHGGEVWAEGAVDRGACVYFTLPAV